MTNENACKSVWNNLFGSVNSGITWTSSQIKSACPPRKKKGKKRLENGEKLLDEEKKDIPQSESSLPKKSYTSPSEICPAVESCCYIKMQDPCRPCCCEETTKPLPCPPKQGPQKPRESVCGCELCQKNPDNEKCCDKNRAFRDINIDREYFEKA
ncbi:PREDICTED: uncharacterized protein LOC108547212 [Eufriesea mexicana]|uniref:uncharacterized protein LOC108547212 n=1 Tax=Eufriesea mexicana TaxID=516756 RepID=UPI00083C4D8D|nr:PREDICTED: uncharacterized protein LOC108547212 [Eufriesea mexicana]